MLDREKTLNAAKDRIHTLEYFDFMGMLAENKRADLELFKDLVALVEQPNEIMKKAIIKASQRIQKLIDRQQGKMVDLFWNLAELERIQDELMGVLEDGSEQE